MHFFSTESPFLYRNPKWRTRVWGSRKRERETAVTCLFLYFSISPLQTILCASWFFPTLSLYACLYCWVPSRCLPLSLLSPVLLLLSFSFPPVSCLAYMLSPFFPFRTMRVSCRPCRSRSRPAPSLQKQRKRRRRKKKVNPRDWNFPVSLLDLQYPICPLSGTKAGFHPTIKW